MKLTFAKPTLLTGVAAMLLAAMGTLPAAETPPAAPEIDRATLDQWSAPYRQWHYWPDHVIAAEPNIPGHASFKNTDVPTVYQLPGQADKWFMSFIAFDGKGYNSFVAESTDLLKWTNPRLAMGFGPTGEFDAGGCVIGAFLYESSAIKAPRLLKKRDGKFWSLYGCYPRLGGYELRPGYEGVASSDDGLTWKRAKPTPILAVQDADCAAWEKDCIYQPWLVEHERRFYNFYNAAKGGTEQTGLAFSTDLLSWQRHPANPVIRNRPGGFDAQFASDPKVFRDGDHWTMLYFGVGNGGAHIMAAFSRDLLQWTAHPEPLYKAGGHPGGLDKQYAHKISLVFNPQNDTFYLYYCACGNKGRGIGLITSKPLAQQLAQEQSVQPGVNDQYKNPNPDEWAAKWETESREIFAQREKIVAACALKPGMSVADIGAGTGLFTRLFAGSVGTEGKVYAVDIAERFVKYVEKTSEKAGLKNVVGVVCAADSAKLPPDSIDLAFICDVYHHFEFPNKTMASIHQALRKDGRLVLIDFHRVEGTSAAWIVKHVRAGQDVFTREIESCGFKLVAEPEEPSKVLKENYCLVFRKVPTAAKPE